MIISEKREDGAILWLTLNAPKANVLTGSMIRALHGALDDEVDGDTKLIVFEGAGAHFSFGASVAEHQRAQAPAMLESFHALFRRLLELAVPTCAVVRGQCLGGGLELASYCTFLVATPDARLGQPEIKLAVFPPMASILLPWRLGGGRALDLCVSGRSLEADEARRMGLVNEVTDDPAGWVLALFASALRPTSAVALRFAERAARAELARRMAEQLPALERIYLDELMATRDANEGIAAFLERRPPELRNA
ncbi:MAG TPA: enoyl-CoA hydratase-related protein [Kofleriaceae bacterium]|nr:enoyl-CoA hydratase-related protein [Kofleriaceae bacterium]